MLDEIEVPMIDARKHSDQAFATTAIENLLSTCNLNIYLKEAGLHDKYFIEMATHDDHASYLYLLEQLMKRASA